jgi:hypothetical protein
MKEMFMMRMKLIMKLKISFRSVGSRRRDRYRSVDKARKERAIGKRTRMTSNINEVNCSADIKVGYVPKDKF